MPYCWRNMFSSICFLRILVKIMKGKPWRVIWLVKYKATNIFKKTLLVKHGVFQLYVLKVIKLHARFLGRQWRKNNMDVSTAKSPSRNLNSKARFFLWLEYLEHVQIFKWRWRLFFYNHVVFYETSVAQNKKITYKHGG